MLPYSLGKEIEENAENLAPQGRCPLPSPSPKKITPPFLLRSVLLSERGEEITYLEAVLPLTALRRSLNPNALNPANTTEFNHQR